MRIRLLLVLVTGVATLVGCTKPKLISPPGRTPAAQASLPIVEPSPAATAAPKPIPGYAQVFGGGMNATGAHFRLQGSVHFVSSPGGNPSGTSFTAKPGIQNVLIENP